ncbi:MucB/RseB C-terminal domain-containing protein [Venatoribacter cucullus]|uniref:Uncharacterized protein n=1 Tax=Venatoribacter cucullus TaxID=2661630 RepID=A0A9E8JML1_9GAMM|nr:MucB/RseB C-terminal domain-containing protein [Venatoribacter cucullus]QQD22124.1 hypothetical protein GJQ54_10290 [Oceanospirillaceae bacterium ASx5O]QQD24796.1 hypothetical protein GJQ55_10110 [Venatoribacter cucullus]UZK04183.1 hypothetical protein GAY96_09875 [Venatoribacter cucullus]
MIKHALLMLSLLLAAQASADGSSAYDWFGRMVQAAREQNYSGVLLYGNQRHWDSLAVQHALQDGQEYERLQRLTGAPLEQLRQGEQVFFLNPAVGQPLQNPLHSFLPGPDLRDQYELTLGGNDRIAGHYARLIVLQPKDQHRYAMRLWLEQKTALLLRSELLDERQQVLERVQFAQLEIGSIMPAELFTRPASEPVPPAPSYPDDDVSWQPDWLPAGFSRLAARQQGDDIQLLFSDGLAAFSVFVDRPAATIAPLQKRWGATAAVVQQVKNEAGESRRVTVVGELPATTLQKIAGSVQPVAAAAPKAAQQE